MRNQKKPPTPGGKRNNPDWDVYYKASTRIARLLEQRGITEDEILRDFAAFQEKKKQERRRESKR